MNVDGSTVRGGRWALGVAAVLSVLFAGGCGDLTSGGFGEVEVEVSADSTVAADMAGSEAAALQPSVAGTPAAAGSRIAAPAQLGPIVGRLTVRVRVLVRHGPASWLEVTDGFQEIELTLTGGGSTVVARRSLPAGRYDRVMLVFGGVVAEVVRGLVVDGDTIRGTIPVELGTDRRLALVRDVGFDVVEGTTSGLVVEMRASRWLRRVNRILRRVAASDFGELLRIRVR